MSPVPGAGRRRLWIGLGVGVVVLTLGLWFAATVEKSPLTRSFGGPKVPKVLAGRDLRPEDERRVVREEEGTATLRCDFDGDGAPGRLVAMGDGEVLSSGADLSLRLPAGSWSVYWEAENVGTLQLGTVVADPGAVQTCRLTRDGWRLAGVVRNLEGQPVPDVSVFACGERARTDASGAFETAAASGACSVRALYQDGILTRRSEPVVVNAFDAGGVELVVDDAPIAGMGLAFRMIPRGARIREVHPGTPAEEAGLEAGDIIVSIDGQPTAGMSDDAFIALGTGREGSRVDLEVERDGERRAFTFRRERIDAVDTG